MVDRLLNLFVLIVEPGCLKSYLQKRHNFLKIIKAAPKLSGRLFDLIPSISYNLITLKKPKG